MDAGNVIPSGQRRYRRLVLDGAQQRITVPDGHHDIGKTGGNDGGQQPLRTVIRRQAVGLVQLRQLLLRQLPKPAGRRHIHPHRISLHLNRQLGGLGVGGNDAVTDASQRPQQCKGGDGGVAAQLHLPCRGKVAQRHAAVRLHGDEGRLGVLELGGDLLHHRVLQRLLRQRHTGLVAAEQAGGKCVHHISFHKNTPQFF